VPPSSESGAPRRRRPVNIRGGDASQAFPTEPRPLRQGRLANALAPPRRSISPRKRGSREGKTENGNGASGAAVLNRVRRSVGCLTGEDETNAASLARTYFFYIYRFAPRTRALDLRGAVSAAEGPTIPIVDAVRRQARSPEKVRR
jgi:hypothetical protein